MTSESCLRQIPGLPNLSTFLGAWTLSLYCDNEMTYVFSQACSLPLYLAHKWDPENLPPDWQHMSIPMFDYPHSLLNPLLPVWVPMDRWHDLWMLNTTVYVTQQIQTPLRLSLYFFLTCSVFLPRSSVKMTGLNTETQIYWCCVCVVFIACFVIG